MNNDLISRDALKEDKVRLIDANTLKYKNLAEVNGRLTYVLTAEEIDNAPTVDIKDQIAGAYNEGYMCGSKEAEKARPQGEWYEYIDKGLLKARHGNYVLYKVDYLLDNLAREVNIMEGARRMKGGAE